VCSWCDGVYRPCWTRLYLHQHWYCLLFHLWPSLHRFGVEPGFFIVSWSLSILIWCLLGQMTAGQPWNVMMRYHLMNFHGLRQMTVLYHASIVFYLERDLQTLVWIFRMWNFLRVLVCCERRIFKHDPQHFHQVSRQLPTMCTAKAWSLEYILMLGEDSMPSNMCNDFPMSL
jgi:hypothetical protein